MARYIKQDQFDAGAATVARANFQGEQGMAAVAAYLAGEYQSTYADSNLLEEWTLASAEALCVCEKLKIEDDLIDSILAGFAYYAVHFDDKGCKKPFWKNLGTWFVYERAPIDDLVDRFRERFTAYALMGKTGILLPEWLSPGDRE